MAIHSFDVVVDAIAHIGIKPPRLTKQDFVSRGAAAMPVSGGYCFAEAFGYALAIRLRFHKHDS